MKLRTVTLAFMMVTVGLSIGAMSPGPQGGTFSPTDDSMTSPRALHRATSLGDGRVLIIGGFGDFAASGNVPTAEIFDPAEDPVFQVTNSAPSQNPECPVVSRAFHRATLLGDGTVLITGGDTRGGGGGSLATAEIFDPIGGNFHGHWEHGPGSTRRSGHTATLLPDDGKVLITGGFDGNAILSAPRLYDPAFGNFAETLGPMVEARFRHTATLLADGKVLIAGGQGAAFGLLDSAEIFSP